MSVFASQGEPQCLYKILHKHCQGCTYLITLSLPIVLCTGNICYSFVGLNRAGGGEAFKRFVGARCDIELQLYCFQCWIKHLR